MVWNESVTASPCSNNTAINFPATATIDPSMIGWIIKFDDKIPKRFGGKDLKMKDVINLRYR